MKYRMLGSNFLSILIGSMMFLGTFHQCLAQEKQASESGKPVASKMFEIGRATDQAISNSVSKLFDSLDQDEWNRRDSNLQLVIYFYGTESEMTRREKLVLREYEEGDLYHVQNTIIRGAGCRPTGIVFWRVPRGAEFPKVCEGKPN